VSETWTTNHGDSVEVYSTVVESNVGAHLEWRYRVRAANGEIVESGESYTRRSAVYEAAERHHPRVETS
jgi:hypothetical protein